MEGNNIISEKLYCRMCKRKTNHSYVEKVDTSENTYELQFYQAYFITKCLGCDNHAFLEEYHDGSMTVYDPYENEYEHYIERTVYPEEPSNLINKREPDIVARSFKNVPESIDMLYPQLVSSYNAKHYLLCAVGLRIIVEAICKESGVSEGNLYDLKTQSARIKENGEYIVRKNLECKLNALYDRGIIVWKQLLVLHQIRELGNVSAHELEVPKRSTIRTGIEVIENILHNIFELEDYHIASVNQ